MVGADDGSLLADSQLICRLDPMVGSSLALIRLCIRQINPVNSQKTMLLWCQHDKRCDYFFPMNRRGCQMLKDCLWKLYYEFTIAKEQTTRFWGVPKFVNTSLRNDRKLRCSAASTLRKAFYKRLKLSQTLCQFHVGFVIYWLNNTVELRLYDRKCIIMHLTYFPR